MSYLTLQKGVSTNLDSVTIKDGQLLVTTDTKQIYLDNDTSRVLIGGGTPEAIGAALSNHSHDRIINGNYQVRTYSVTTDNRIGYVSTKADVENTFYWFATDTSATAKLRYILYNNSSSVQDGYVYTTNNKPTITDINGLVTPTVTWTGGTTAGPTLKIKDSFGQESSAVAIPVASNTTSGVITTGSQTISGAKSFSGSLTAYNQTSYAYICFKPTNNSGVPGSITYEGPYLTTADDGTVTYTNRSRFYLACYSHTTGTTETIQRLSYYYRYYWPNTPADLTANKAYYMPVSTAGNLGGVNQPVYLASGQVLTKCNSFVPSTGGTFTGDLTIQKTTTIASNASASLFFKTVQSDNSITSTASIRVYDDHDAAANGMNMVVQSSGNMIIGSGESPNSCYTNLLKDSTTENMYITSDSNIYFYTNCQTWSNHTTSCYISTAGVLYGACWNDYAEYRQGQKEYKPGTCVIEVGDDTLIESTERLQGGALIVSDTFGFAIGETDEAKTPIATSGRVLAYPFEPRESYLPGDPVCSGPNGTVSKMTEQEVMMYPHKMIGTVSAIPDYEEWGTGNIKINGRIWIQIR